MNGQNILELHGSAQSKSAFAIASGPSSGLANPDTVRNFAKDKITIGTNDVWRVLDGGPINCDYFVILDIRFYEDHFHEIRSYLQNYPNSIPITYFDLDIPHFRIPIDMNWDARQELRGAIQRPYHPDNYFHGHSSGVAACQFAMKLGCSEIYLLGHDLITIPTRTHGFGIREQEKKTNYQQGLTMRSGYDLLATHAEQEKISIINLSAISSLDQFPNQSEILQ